MVEGFHAVAARHGNRPVRFRSLYRDYCWSLRADPVPPCG
jgi:hypothetical protein